MLNESDLYLPRHIKSMKRQVIHLLQQVMKQFSYLEKQNSSSNKNKTLKRHWVRDFHATIGNKGLTGLRNAPQFQMKTEECEWKLRERTQLTAAAESAAWLVHTCPSPRPRTWYTVGAYIGLLLHPGSSFYSVLAGFHLFSFGVWVCFIVFSA